MTAGRRHLLYGLFLTLVLLFAFKPVSKLVILCLDRTNSDISHTILIPFISATLIYWNRSRIFRELATSPLPATAALLAGGLLYYIAFTRESVFSQNDYLTVAIASVVAFSIGGFLLVYGTNAFRAALFPLLFLVLTIPIPEGVLDRIVSVLQEGSATLTSILFTLTGTPAYREGVVFVLPSITIEIAKECSGIRSTLGIFIVTLLASHMLLRSSWRKTLLLLVVIPISLFKNAVRIVVLTLLAIHVDMGFITGRLHNDGGILFMLLGLGLMYPVLTALMKSEGGVLDSGVRS